MVAITSAVRTRSADLAGGIPRLLQRFWTHLSARRRHQFVALTIVMLISALLEVVSLSAVLPFIGVLTSPDWVFRRPQLARMLHAWHIMGSERLVLVLTIAFAAAALIAGAVRTFVLWSSTRLACSTGADISILVYRTTLYQPYSVHLGRNSSEVISGIVTKAQEVVFGVLQPVLTLISSAVILTVITVALVVIDPVINTIAILGFGATYLLVSWLSRDRLMRNSRRISREQTQVLKALQEGLGGIRDVLLDGTQQVYCAIFRRANYPLRIAQGNNLFLTQGPRFAMEALGMVLIAALAFALSRTASGLGGALPVLGTLALGAQRLLPALQQTHSSWAAITGYSASLADTIVLLEQPVAPELLEPPPPPMRFDRTIEMRGVRFRYGEQHSWALDGTDLMIRKGQRIGLVGSTGSGKTTALDVLMGLLVPGEGQVLVDGQPLDSLRMRAWQQNIAHVPQSIFLADTTLAENIAFGIPRHLVDLERVRAAARVAQILEFIESRPEGFNALVGERGMRLSGGQRQRIGIARALYKRTAVLVLDEATSALDNQTEECVMDAVANLDANLTILLVAHRLNTVRSCDRIFELEQGKVVRQGTYAELLYSSPSFRLMERLRSPADIGQ